MIGEVDVNQILKEKAAKEKEALDAVAKRNAEAADRARQANDLQAAARVRWDKAVLPLLSDCFNDYRLKADELGITATVNDVPQIPGVTYTFGKKHSLDSVSLFFMVTPLNVVNFRDDRVVNKQKETGTNTPFNPGEGEVKELFRNAVREVIFGRDPKTGRPL